MHDIESDALSTDEVEALEHMIGELQRAIDMAEMSRFDHLRELLVQVRSKAEAHLGRPPASKLQ